jgi:hypothetical protein
MAPKKNLIACSARWPHGRRCGESQNSQKTDETGEAFQRAFRKIVPLTGASANLSVTFGDLAC